MHRDVVYSILYTIKSLYPRRYIGLCKIILTSPIYLVTYLCYYLIVTLYCVYLHRIIVHIMYMNTVVVGYD